jgi:hypothetical protein
MYNEPTAEIENQLAPGERLLWSGRPKQGFYLQASDLWTIPFSLMWCGFAIFWEYGVCRSHAPFFFKLWGIPFVLIGLYLVIGRFFVDAQNRSKTLYGVTNTRVIIISGNFSRQIKSLQLRTLSDISLVERSDDRGTIYLGPQNPMGQNLPPGWPGAGRYAAPAFENIEQAKEVYEIIRKAQTAA